MWPGVPNDGTLLCVWYARHSASLQAAGASGKDMRMVICQTRMRIWEGLREELGPHSREEARAAWACADGQGGCSAVEAATAGRQRSGR